MQKVKGVDKVQVSLNEGLTILDFKPENTVNLSDLRHVIKNNGFVAKEAHVIARGAMRSVNGQSIFEVSGSGETLVPTAAPQRTGDDWRFTVAASK